MFRLSVPLLLITMCGMSSVAQGVDTLELEKGEIIEVLGPERAARIDSSEIRLITRRAPPKLSVTFSPIHLAVPFVEITGEYRPSPFWSLSLISGSSVYPYTADLREIGGQFRAYLGGGNSGFHIGVEGFYARFQFADMRENEEDRWFYEFFKDFEVNVYGGGPFAGLKRVSLTGYTMDLQAGVQFMKIQNDGEYNLYPIINVNFGKSFF